MDTSCRFVICVAFIHGHRVATGSLLEQQSDLKVPPFCVDMRPGKFMFYALFLCHCLCAQS